MRPYEHASDVGLISDAKRLVLWGRVSMAGLFGCFAAGIWVDWRWLATAIIPLLVLAVVTVSFKQINDEMEQRPHLIEAIKRLRSDAYGEKDA